MVARRKGHTRNLEPQKAKTAEYEKLFEGGVASLRQVVSQNPMLGIAVGKLINRGAVKVVGTTFHEGQGLDVENVKVESDST